MDEPILHLRDGASVTTIPLTELLGMVDLAQRIALGEILGNQQAVAAVDMVTRAATTYGPQRGKASVSLFLLNHARAMEREKQESAIVVAPAQNVGAGPAQTAPAVAEPGAATPPPGAAAAPVTPCQHPPDIACPNCASAHQEARNAKKRQGARA